jgi:hypothetical protein
MRLYDYTCSACRLRIITPDGRSAVDAAHIIPFSESYDDGIGNGLALCKLHHWAFDAGLLSLTDRHRLLIYNSFAERVHAGLLLRNLEVKPHPKAQKSSALPSLLQALLMRLIIESPVPWLFGQRLSWKRAAIR